jgi:hypothetical protein
MDDYVQYWSSAGSFLNSRKGQELAQASKIFQRVPEAIKMMAVGKVSFSKKKEDIFAQLSDAPYFCIPIATVSESSHCKIGDSVAQLVEQYTFNVWALGSSPSRITPKTA